MKTAEIQKTKKRQFTGFSIFLRKISVVIAHYLNELSITPNQVSIFRVVVFGGISMYLFYSESYLYNLLGLGTIALYYIFDLVDGDLARNHDKVTKLGGFLDGNLDAIVLNSIILTFTLRYVNDGIAHFYVMVSVMILFGTIFSAKMTDFFKYKFSIDCCQGSDPVEKYLEHHRLDMMSVFFYGLITPKGLLLSLFSNFRYYLIIGVIFGIMPITMLVFSIAINIRWITLFMMIVGYYSGIDRDDRKIKLFNIMKKNEQ